MATVSIREQWEGRVAAGKFPLLEFLGGSDDCSVFLTLLEGAQKAAIKLIPDDPEGDVRLAFWEKAKALSHPHLMKIFECGRCAIDDVNLLYVVTERAETDLAQLIPNKALDSDEAANIFRPVTEALLHLHQSEIIHGRVRPSNILLVSGQAKLSTDGVLAAGGVTLPVRRPGNYDAPEVLNGRPSAAADTWSLGMSLAEALTRQLPSWDWKGTGEPAPPESLPEPYMEIVRECLRLNPSQRCTLRSIVTRLEARAFAGPAPAAENGARQPGPATGASGSREVPFQSGWPPAQSGSSLRQPDPVPIKEAPVSPKPQPSPFSAAAPRESAAPAAERTAPFAAARPDSFGPEKPASRWNFEPDPMPRVFTYLEESEPEPRRFPVVRLVVGLIVLLGIGAVLFVGIPKDDVDSLLARLNLRSPSQSEVPAPSQPAPNASPSPAQSPTPTTGEPPTQPQTAAPQPQPPAASATQSPSNQPAAPASGQAASQPGTSPGSQPATQPAPQSGSQAAAQTGSQATPTATAPSARASGTQGQPQAPAPPPSANSEGAVASRVMPDISGEARGGMERPITVTLRVFVSRDGLVSEVAYLTSGPGNYFARRAYRAAQEWKFSPPTRRGQPQPSVWTLRFYFSRGATDVDATLEGR